MTGGHENILHLRCDVRYLKLLEKNIGTFRFSFYRGVSNFAKVVLGRTCLFRELGIR